MKGSLQLSINAIVVLIIAIAMLGVGIYFVNSVLKGQLEDSITLTNDVKEQIKIQVRDSNSKLFISGLTNNNVKIPLGKTNENVVIAMNNMNAQPLNYHLVLEFVKAEDNQAKRTSVFYNDIGTIDVNDIGFEGVRFSSINNRGKEIWKVSIYNCDNPGDECTEVDKLYDSRTFFVTVQ